MVHNHEGDIRTLNYLSSVQSEEERDQLLGVGGDRSGPEARAEASGQDDGTIGHDSGPFDSHLADAITRPGGVGERGRRRR